MTTDTVDSSARPEAAFKLANVGAGGVRMSPLVIDTLHRSLETLHTNDITPPRTGAGTDVVSYIADLRKEDGSTALSADDRIKKAKQDAVDKLEKAADEKLSKDQETVPVKPSADQRRPADDTRSARQIIDESPLLKNLGSQDNVDKKLIDKVGDYKNDADATYRAVKLLEYIEKVDRDGKPAAPHGDSNKIGNGRIDGYTKDGEARHDSEAGRLQDFTRGNGYEGLVDGNTQRQPVPAVDDLRAQDIQDANPLLKSLTNNNGVRDKLKEKVGDFDTDVNAAARAVVVLEDIKTSKDANGNDRASGVTENGRIDGFDDNGNGAHGTEAGLLQDYLKGGNAALKADHRLDAEAPPGPKPINNTFGPELTRPAGDFRSAQDIINGNAALKNLGDQHGAPGQPSLKEALKKQVGDFEHDADAAYRATVVLDHVERFDESGKEIKNRAGSGGRGATSKIDTVGNGTIDGFTNSGDAQHGTEAGRLQDFGQFGWSSLKGGDTQSETRNALPLLPLANQVQPDDDHRSAQEIIDANPTLKNLGNQENVKDNLKNQVGDYEHDANAAYRASQVIDYIKNVDEKGQQITHNSSGNDPGNDRVDGFSKDGDHEVANHGTEAGRLKDFGKDGYSSLKGIDGRSADQLISQLNVDATADVVKAEAGDFKKLGADYFNGGKTDANAADKTAALIKLSETLATFKMGQEAYQTPDTEKGASYVGDGPSPGEQRDAFYKDVQSKIDQLTKDPDVQKFMNEKVPAALHARVNSDPQLKAELQRRFDNASSSHALEDAFNKKDKDGNPVSTTQALTEFVGEPNFYAQALDIKPNLQQALGNAPQDIKDKVRTGYDHITSGEDLKRLTDAGTPTDKALIETGVNKAVYDCMFDDPTVKEGTDKFNDTTAKVGRDQLLDGKSIQDLYKGLGIKDANDPALEQIIEKNLDSIAPPGPERPKAKDIVAFLRSVDDIARGGAKFDDQMLKASATWQSKAPDGVSEAYKAGVMHAASSVLLSGALIAGAATGTQGTPGMTVAQSLQAAGLMTEGGAKFITDQISRGTDFGKHLQSGNWIKDMENVGKALGGVLGNVIGLVAGSISASDAAARGDKVGAGFQGTFAALNGVSAVAGSVEVAAYLATRVMTQLSQAAVESVAVIGGIAGAVAGAVGGAAAIGGMIYSIFASIKEDAKRDAQRDDWYDGVKSDFNAFGITPPELGTTISPPNASPNTDGPPAPGY